MLKQVHRDTKEKASPGPNDAITTAPETEASAFNRFYQRYFAKFAADLRTTYGAGPPEPEEVAQQAFANLLKRGSFDEISNPEDFIWMSARNIIVSEARKKKVRQDGATEVLTRFYGTDIDDFNPERVFIGKEELSRMMTTLRAMPARRRHIFLLNRLQGLTPAAIARQLGVGRTTVVHHIGKASEQLYRAMIAPTKSDRKDDKGYTK